MLLPGEGSVVMVKAQRVRRTCCECDAPATRRLTYLLPNARTNPASNGYQRDDVRWCSDRDLFSCDDHEAQLRSGGLRGYEWCGTFHAISAYAHMFLYDKLLTT